MKLHYSADTTSIGTTRKLKSVVLATEGKVEQIIHNVGDDISAISAINTLPLLQTSDGTFFSSNTIARYLASFNKKELYGSDNLHIQALIDQWLDITTCDLEPAVKAVCKHHHGEKIQMGKLMEDINKFIDFIEAHLAEKKFLVADIISIADLSLASSISTIFELLIGEGKRKKYPNILKWYSSIVAINQEVGVAEFPKEENVKKGKKKGDKKGENVAKQEVKKEDDLFDEPETVPPTST